MKLIKILAVVAILAPLGAQADSTLSRTAAVKTAVATDLEIAGITEAITKQRHLICKVGASEVKLGNPAKDKTAADTFSLEYNCNSAQGADVQTLRFKGYAIESGTLISVDTQSIRIIESE